MGSAGAEALQLESEDEEFRDPHGIWLSAQRLQDPTAPLDPGRMMATHRSLHARFLAAWEEWHEPMVCDGLRCQRGHSQGRRCLCIGCPSCWYRRTMELFRLVAPLKSPLFYLKVIESDWRYDIHPGMLQQFKADRTPLRLLAHAVGLDSDAAYNWETGHSGADAAVDEQMPIYRLVGLFAVNERVKSRKLTDTGHGDHRRMEFDVDSALYKTGLIDYYEFGSIQEAMEQWLVLNPYPYRVAGSTQSPVRRYSGALSVVNHRFPRSGRINEVSILREPGMSG